MIRKRKDIDSYAENLKIIEEQKRLGKRILSEMSLANGNDCYRNFPYPRYKVYIYSSNEHFIDGQAHFHVIDIQEDWEIKVSMRGDLIEVVNYGRRDSSDTFVDIERKLKMWLPRKNTKYPEISNFVRLQRLWNDNNEEKGLGIEVEEW
jgi:hypothetical protein